MTEQRVSRETPRRATDPIGDWLETLPITVGQLWLVAFVATALIFDGLDVKILSFAAPVILEEWHITKAAFGPALASALLGMAIGAAWGGWLGDRYGRRTVILLSLILFGIATIAAGFTHDVYTLAAFRFVSGIGFGSLTPNGFALVTEWLPARGRPAAIGLLSLGSPCGGMVGAGLALWLLPAYGWHGCFVIMGIATLLVGAVLFFFLPESPRFLLARGNFSAALAQCRSMVRGDGANVAGVERAALQHFAPTAAPRDRGSIFRPDLARLNLGAFLCFFASYFVNYVFSSWLPIVLTSSGMTIAQSIRGSLYFNTTAVAGSFLAGILIRRFGTKWLLITASITQLAALSATPFLLENVTGTYSAASESVMAIVAISGLASGTIATTISAVVALGYPVAARSTGVGFGVMAGRIGGIVASLVGGVLLSIQGAGPIPLFAVLCVFTVLGLIATMIVDRHAGGEGAIIPLEIGAPGRPDAAS